MLYRAESEPVDQSVAHPEDVVRHLIKGFVDKRYRVYVHEQLL